MLASRARTFTRLAAQQAKRAPSAAPVTQRRGMATAHEWTGIDKTVRDALGNKDEHLVIAILSGYFGLYLISKAVSGGKKEEAPVPVTASTTTTTSDSIPSVDSPDFEKWIDAPGNVDKLVASWEK